LVVVLFLQLRLFNLVRSRNSSQNIRSSLSSILLEVLGEHTGELVNGGDESSLIGPCLVRIEDRVRNPLALLRDLEAPAGNSLEFGLFEGAVVHSVDDGTGETELHAATALAEATTRPTGVDEPDVGVELLHVAGEEFTVNSGVHD